MGGTLFSFPETVKRNPTNSFDRTKNVKEKSSVLGMAIAAAKVTVPFFPFFPILLQSNRGSLRNKPHSHPIGGACGGGSTHTTYQPL